MARRRSAVQDGREVRDRRDFRRRLVVSVSVHAAAILFLAIAPAPKARPLPSVVTVDLVASLRPSQGAPKPAPKPAPAALPKPAPPKPPPPPAPKQIILPKNPAPVPDKPRKAVRKEVMKPRPRPRPEELEYDDALAKLREELGEPSAPTGEATEDNTAPEPDAPPSSGAGVPVPPEVMRWIIDTKRHIRATYITPSEFLGRGLVTCMEVFLALDGRVLGEPNVTRSSGNIYWDDNAVRATLRASPLPAPPAEGDWIFCFPTEERD